MRGLPANNVLLTGARGTGKSSLIRACLTQFQADGLRLIEVDKNDLIDLPDIVALVAARPERFIVFCDDLSFEEGESAYKALKAALDGSVAAPSENVLIYATSNRRHLMPEYMRENLDAKYQEDGEIHPGETVEEKISLSERFGLWLSFYPFRQDDYLAIVAHWLVALVPSSPDRSRTQRGAAVRSATGVALGTGCLAVRAGLGGPPRHRPILRRSRGRARQRGSARASAMNAAASSPRVAVPAASASIIDVAVGVLIRADGAVLFGQRPAGKPYAGWWEFPGGKLEAGESVEQALARELHEELGIVVHESRPWVVREHVYPHAHVRLSFQRIVSWSGEPRPREAQALAWRHPTAIDLAPLLPAAIPGDRVAAPARPDRHQLRWRTRRRVLPRSTRPASRGRTEAGAAARTGDGARALRRAVRRVRALCLPTVPA